jgi:hypothetical protein
MCSLSNRFTSISVAHQQYFEEEKMTGKFVSTLAKKLQTVLAFIALFTCINAVLPFAALAAPKAREFAFYGTNRADWTVLTTPDADPQPFVWKIIKNPADPAPGAAQISVFNWGQFGDVITPGSWTGDATTKYDPGIWRAGTGYWIFPFETGGTTNFVTPWGAGGDNLGREGDYDGDGIMDPTVIRILGGQLGWWIKLSTTGQTRVTNFGTTATNQSTFAFRGKDFTGDGRDELIVARVINANGICTWFIGDAVTGAQVMQVTWGNFNTDFLINPADYTGDGKADLITWRAGAVNAADRTWYIYNPVTNTQAAPIGLQFGIGDSNFINNDLPVRGDYDGDLIDDICVWRPSNATFYCRASSNASLIVQQWGLTDDTPLGTFFTF